MNEKTTNMEEGRMGREKRNLGLVKETAFKSETLQADASNHLQRPARCSRLLGCRPPLQTGVCLAGGHAGMQSFSISSP